MPTFLWQKLGLPEPILSQDQVTSIIDLARKTGPRDYFLFSFLGVRGWRIGTITGIQRTNPPVNLPGIRKEDVEIDGIVVHSKGGKVRKNAVPGSLLVEAQDYARTLRKGDRLVPLSERQALNLCKEYAGRVGVQHPETTYNHLFRHAFGTYWARKTGKDPWKLCDLMGHADLRATKRYVYSLTLQEERELLG